ncbi:MAG: hypothetical protein AB4368_11500 [Xenococcaceae cyanobacterium]
MFTLDDCQFSRARSDRTILKDERDRYSRLLLPYQLKTRIYSF